MRIVPVIAVLLGLIGVIVCGSFAVGTWVAGARARQANRQIFQMAEQAFDAVALRLDDVERRVEKAQLTGEELRAEFRNWSRQKAGENLVSTLEIEQKAQRLTLGLAEVDLWMEFTLGSLDAISQAVLMGNSLGISFDPSGIERPRTKLANLRSELAQVTTTVEGVRETAADFSDPELRQDRLEEILAVGARILATLGDLDKLLAELRVGLTSLKSDAMKTEKSARRWILGTTATLLFLALWMGAGQAALVMVGKQYFRGSTNLERSTQ